MLAFFIWEIKEKKRNETRGKSKWKAIYYAFQINKLKEVKRSNFDWKIIPEKSKCIFNYNNIQIATEHTPLNHVHTKGSDEYQLKDKSMVLMY